MAQTYQYKVRDKSGNLICGTLVADNEMLVLQRLREQGYTPLEVGKEKKGLNVNIQLTKKKVKLKEVAVFSRQFATMINSGLPILRALADPGRAELEHVAVRGAHGRPAPTWSRASSLSQALAKHPKIFNDLYIAMVKSGETGGSLDTRSCAWPRCSSARSSCAARSSPR